MLVMIAIMEIKIDRIMIKVIFFSPFFIRPAGFEPASRAFKRISLQSLKLCLSITFELRSFV